MDAHFFRCLALELGPALTGARFQKVFQPAPDVWTMETGLRGGRAFLVLRHGRAGGLLFASDHKPENPDSPPARCMWLRKRLRNRRVTGHASDWAGRRLALALTPGPEDQSPWLVLDLASGPALVSELPAGFSPGMDSDVGAEPDWPTLDRAANDPDIWREFPHISPALRRSLHNAAPAEAAAIWRAVRSGGCAAFWVGQGGEVLAWPPVGTRSGQWREIPTAMEAAELAGRRTLFPDLVGRDTRADAVLRTAEERRLRKALANLDRDEERLRGMAALSDDGQAVKAVLHQHGADARLARVEVPDGDGARVLELDRRLTLVANMERLFARAAKGRRGLDFVAGRRAELEGRLAALGKGMAPEGALGAKHAATTVPVRPSAQGLPSRMRGLAVAAFRTSDGFAAYRGKSAKGNHELLSRAAAPHDLWFHAAHGPGAHVVLKLDHPGQEPPEQSMEQAAALAGLRSHFAGPNMRPGTRAEVICARVRDVRKVKGAALGSVHVDRVWRTFLVDLDPDMEAGLSV